jgi:hypothetical protein
MLQAGKYQYALRVTFESFVESGVWPGAFTVPWSAFSAPGFRIHVRNRTVSLLKDTRIRKFSEVFKLHVPSFSACSVTNPGRLTLSCPDFQP